MEDGGESSQIATNVSGDVHPNYPCAVCGFSSAMISRDGLLPKSWWLSVRVTAGMCKPCVARFVPLMIYNSASTKSVA